MAFAGILALGIGSYTSFRLAYPKAERVSDLTLANIEAMSQPIDDEMDSGIVIGICGSSYLQECNVRCSSCNTELSAGVPGPKQQSMGSCPNCGAWVL